MQETGFSTDWSADICTVFLVFCAFSNLNYMNLDKSADSCCFLFKFPVLKWKVRVLSLLEKLASQVRRVMTVLRLTLFRFCMRL